MSTEDVVVVVEGIDVDRHDVPASRFAPITAGGSSKSDAISVEQYTEDGDDDCDVRVLDSVPAETRFSSSRKRKKKSFSGSSVTETGQPSNSKSDPPFICEVCAVPRTNEVPFRITGCGHACCNDCVTKHVASKLHDNVTRVGCPVLGCGGVLELGHCSSILPPEVFDRWGNALCEALILEAERFYCPFTDCSALLIDEGGAVGLSVRSFRG
ncbi:E3 ubiquitin-protein ligase RSL1-like [Syzygium oleosum]|uniref:E3 ubiquitin-protein ligase RSL1-like n=1 Tax=Syzygium oleosum TaxID=219896 RepID=UPI0024BA96B6|nr:E3 ubiquitin-protein ligase RSL1-like [Syzygium oleosum]